MLRAPSLATFYRPEQVCIDLIADHSTSKSPLKPRLVIERLQELGAGPALALHSFPPFDPADFLAAHSEQYVRDFFAGKPPLCSSNMLPWSKALVDSVCYTNASLYYAQKAAILNPEQISFSPTSGFHHARPERGAGFCTFSGQVISAVKLYQEFGVAGAWIDLDAHFGNSIENSREVIPDLNYAIPPHCNLNPAGEHHTYLYNLALGLNYLKQELLAGRIHWIAFAHGADSHEADDLGGQLTTAEWFQASEMVYNWVAELDNDLGRPVPLTLALFGGYREDDYQSVIDLHAGDALTCLKILVSKKWDYSLS